MRRSSLPALILAGLAVALSTTASAQPAPATRPSTRPGGGAGGRPPAFISPEVQADRRITFRLFAPRAESVRLNGGDIPGGGGGPGGPGGPGQARTLSRNDAGVWELTLGPVEPGSFRYTFNVDGLAVVDPRNPAVSESNATVWSVVHVPGSDVSDAADVPHGAVAAVHYRSSALGKMRRMHIYTPPGYEAGQDRYPVLYLLHGASDSDHSWTSVGRANFILDNLIAAGKARPMIVVMPAGHTGPFTFGAPGGGGGGGGRPNLGNAAFEEDFRKDIRPYVEKHYRVLADRDHRAIAGLSMGGMQTLNVALADLKDYGYVGVFSSGLLFRNLADVEKDLQAKLTPDVVKAGPGLLWFATGSQDFLINQTRQSVELLTRLGLKPAFKETAGGHTWVNWRAYLHEFAPQLFGNAPSAPAAGK